MCTGADTPTAKFFINCLAEPPEEVAQFLVPRIRKVPQEMRSLNGAVGQVTLPACPWRCPSGVAMLCWVHTKHLAGAPGDALPQGRHWPGAPTILVLLIVLGSACAIVAAAWWHAGAKLRKECTQCVKGGESHSTAKGAEECRWERPEHPLLWKSFSRRS